MAPPDSWLQQNSPLQEVFAGWPLSINAYLSNPFLLLCCKKLPSAAGCAACASSGNNLYRPEGLLGEVQCVAAPESIKEHHLKLEDAVEIVGRVRREARAKAGYELDIFKFASSIAQGSVSPSIRFLISTRWVQRR